jgi:putative Holliday junction resolvase
MPLNWDDSPTDATPWVEKLAAELRKKFPEIPVAFEDERNTSKMAVESMVRSGMKKKKRRQKEEVDLVSATIILQQFMQK